MQLRDRPRLLDGRVVLTFADLLPLLDDDRLAGGKVGGKELRVVHVSKYNQYFGKCKSTSRKNFSENEEGAFRDESFAKSPWQATARRCRARDLFQPARE